MESKMKLSGLLVERVAVDHTVGLNLRAAMDQARQRTGKTLDISDA